MNRSLPALDRRRFLATAGSGAALAAAGVVTAPTSGAAHAQTSTGAVDVITVDGAIPGIPYRTRTSILDVAEYARRAQVNSAAFTNAWTRALQRLAEVPAPANSPASGNSVNWRPNSGVVIRVDPGFYAIDQWSMATRPADLGLPGSESEGHQYGEWSVRITIEAEGVVLVAKDHQGTSVGSPVVYLGNPDSPGGSRDLLKRVTLRGLTVQSDGDSLQGGYVADRIGMLVHQSQEIRLEQVSVFGFARDGIRLEGVMDSTIDAAVVGWCGRPSRLATAPDPLPFGLSLASTRDSSGAILENCNAVRVIDSHLEFCEQELYLDRGTRHVEFIGCKFEHGWGTTSAQSPISIGSPANTRSAHDRVLEIGFTSCMFVQNTYANAGSHPSHIVVGEVTYGGGEAAAAKTAITFNGCHFSVPDGGGERWFTGGDTTFVGCDFAGCGNAEGEPPCFDLGNDVTFDDCRFAAMAELHDGVTGSRRAGEPGAAVPGSRADLFRFRGGASRVINPVIYFPPPTEGVHTSPGSVATLAGGAGDANRIAGWHPAFYGLPGDGSGRPGPIAAVRYEETGRTQLGSSLVWEAMSGASTPVLEPDAQGRVSVCGREQIRVQGGRTYRGFTDAYAGQVVRVVADGEPITFVGGSLVLKGTQTLRGHRRHDVLRVLYLRLGLRMVSALTARARTGPVKPTIGRRLDPRSNSLNAVRLVLALLVLVAHGEELGGYGRHLQPIGPWAVAGFFCISGYLIALSRRRARGSGDFFLRRIVRIYPAFFVVLVVVAFVIAPLASVFLNAGPWRVDAAALYVARNAGLWIVQPALPDMLVQLPYPGVWNGSLWTLAYEFACYVVTGLIGFLAATWGLRTTIALWVGSTAVAVLAGVGVVNLPHTLATFATLLAFYLSGTLLLVWQDRVPLRPALMIGAAAVVAAVAITGAPQAVAGPAMAYLMIAAGILLPLRRIGARNDISYGIYIYAFPVQQLLALALADRGVPFIVPLALAMALTIPLAWASWVFVERPAIRAHRRWASRRRKAGVA